MTAKDLKNALLQEAVQGKLVPQKTCEGNARDLLEEIRKARGESLPLATARKRSSATPSAGTPRNAPMEIPEDEIPFDIPESWCWCRLGEICKIKGGKRLPLGCTFSETITDHVYIRVSDMKNNTVSLDDLHYISDEVYEKIKKYIITTDDIYMTIVGATIGKCGIIPDCLNNMNLTENAARIIPFIIDKYYLLMCLTTDFCQSQFLEKTKQVGVQKMALTRFANTMIPLPPLAEQKRIVAAIEKFMPLIEEYGKKETVLNELNAQIGTLTKKAILQEAVQGKLVPQIPAEGNAKDLLEQIKAQKVALIKEGKIKKEKPLPEITEDEIPFDIPENWCWCRLGELSTLVTKGTTPRGGNVAYLDCGVGFLRAENVAGTKDLDLSNLKFIDEDTHNNFLKRSVLEENDLLITIAGTLGRTAIVKKGDLPLNANQAISIVRLVNPDLVCLEYLIFAINAPELQRKLIGQTKVTAIPNLTLEIIENCEIPLPPLSEQKRIVTAIEQLLPLCEKLGK